MTSCSAWINFLFKQHFMEFSGDWMAEIASSIEDYNYSINHSNFIYWI